MNKNKAILVLGAPRSGTSITTRIIQEHLDTDFPFKVTRHAEPEHLMNIERDFMERNGKHWDDRLYFPDMQPDMQLFSDLLDFYKKYADTECVIKSPIFSIFSNWIQIPRMFRSVYVYRGTDGMARSLVGRKNMSKSESQRDADWYYENAYKLHVSGVGDMVLFDGKEKKNYKTSLRKAIQNMGIEWNEDAFNKHWDESEIESYKNAK